MVERDWAGELGRTEGSLRRSPEAQREEAPDRELVLEQAIHLAAEAPALEWAWDQVAGPDPVPARGRAKRPLVWGPAAVHPSAPEWAPVRGWGTAPEWE